MNIAVDNLEPGMILLDNVYKSEKDVIPYIHAKTVLTEKIIDKLKQSDSIKYVPVSYKTTVVETIPEDINSLALSALRSGDIESSVKIAKVIVDIIERSKNFNYDISKYIIEYKERAKKSVNTCSFAVAMAKAYNNGMSSADKLDLDLLSVAALLKDLGKNCEDNNTFKNLPKLMFNKSVLPNAPTDIYEKYDEKYNSVYSYIMLNGISSIPTAVKTTILLSDEKKDKTGPFKVDPSILNDKLRKMINIINVAGHYTDLLYEVVGQNKNPSIILEQITKEARKGIIDPEAASLLLDNIPLFCNGTRVMLSNGLEATVMEQNPNEPLLPKIIVEEDESTTIVDMKQIYDVKIAGINKNYFNYDDSKEETRTVVNK